MLVGDGEEVGDGEGDGVFVLVGLEVGWTGAVGVSVALLVGVEEGRTEAVGVSVAVLAGVPVGATRMTAAEGAGAPAPPTSAI